MDVLYYRTCSQLQSYILHLTLQLAQLELTSLVVVVDGVWKSAKIRRLLNFRAPINRGPMCCLKWVLGRFRKILWEEEEVEEILAENEFERAGLDHEELEEQKGGIRRLQL